METLPLELLELCLPVEGEPLMTFILNSTCQWLRAYVDGRLRAWLTGRVPEELRLFLPLALLIKHHLIPPGSDFIPRQVWTYRLALPGRGELVDYARQHHWFPSPPDEEGLGLALNEWIIETRPSNKEIRGYLLIILEGIPLPPPSSIWLRVLLGLTRVGRARLLDVYWSWMSRPAEGPDVSISFLMNAVASRDATTMDLVTKRLNLGALFDRDERAAELLVIQCYMNRVPGLPWATLMTDVTRLVPSWQRHLTTEWAFHYVTTAASFQPDLLEWCMAMWKGGDPAFAPGITAVAMRSHRLDILDWLVAQGHFDDTHFFFGNRYRQALCRRKDGCESPKCLITWYRGKGFEIPPERPTNRIVRHRQPLFQVIDEEAVEMPRRDHLVGDALDEDDEDQIPLVPVPIRGRRRPPPPPTWWQYLFFSCGRWAERRDE